MYLKLQNIYSFKTTLCPSSSLWSLRHKSLLVSGKVYFQGGWNLPTIIAQNVYPTMVHSWVKIILEWLVSARILINQTLLRFCTCETGWKKRGKVWFIQNSCRSESFKYCFYFSKSGLLYYLPLQNATVIFFVLRKCSIYEHVQSCR